jgi:hypothetical protein
MESSLRDGVRCTQRTPFCRKPLNDAEPVTMLSPTRSGRVSLSRAATPYLEAV